MTATTVDGLSVIASERVESPLSNPERVMFYVHTLKLLLEDGSVVYGCSECDFTSERLGTARSHWQVGCLKNPKSLANGGVRKRRTRVNGQVKNDDLDDAEELASLLAQILDDTSSKDRIAELERELQETSDGAKELIGEVKALKAELAKEKRAVGQWRQRAETADTIIIGIRKVLQSRGRVP